VADLTKHLRLEYLDLGRTKVSDAGLAKLGNLSGLVSHYLDDTPITGPALEQVAKLRNLERLGLHWTAVADQDLMKLAGLPKL
jgi:hypothetical protein